MGALSASAANYKFEAIGQDGKPVATTQNCSSNWARTNGAARRFEKANPGAFTKLVKLKVNATCDTAKTIAKKAKQ